MMPTSFPLLVVCQVLLLEKIAVHAQFIRSGNQTNPSYETAPVQATSASSSLQVSLLFLFFILLLVIGICCSIYSICGQWKCQPLDRGLSFDSSLSRSASYYREDLLNEDELLRLWICWYCDFANYEMKTHCALCGNEKKEKLFNRTSDGKVPTVRPASLLASSLAATALSSSVPSPNQSFMSPTTQHEPYEESPLSIRSPGQATLSPSGLTPRSMRAQRKEWRPVLDANQDIVWSHHRDPTVPPTSTDGIVSATSFVGRIHITPEHPHGKVDLEPAEGARVYCSSRADYPQASDQIDPVSVETIRNLSFPEKHRWFMQETSSILNVRWNNPTMSTDMTLLMPRDDLLHATMRGLIRVSQKQLHRPLRVQFQNEPGIDAGGIVREWFGLVVTEFLNENNGLFQTVHTTKDGIAYTINPNAAISVEDYLLYFRAFGRLLGKALLEGHLVPVPLTDVLLKLILSVPISFADLTALDGKLAQSLQLLWDTTLLDPQDEDEEDMYGFDFSVYHTTMGIVDLKPNGRNIVVNEANKKEYITLYTQWHLACSITEEVGALVSGVYDVLPMHLLAPFDYQELRLMLCGSPVIDLKDWEEHTLVIGKKKRTSRLIQWFWRILKTLSVEDQERILQFATGTCRVPVQGFKALTTSDGRLCPFTINCLPKSECVFIRAYTCFNRLDLPIYKSEKELEHALRLVAQMDVTGFSIQ